MSTHKRQNCKTKTFGGAQRSRGGGNPKVLLFLYKYRKVQENREHFPSETGENTL